MKDISEFKDGQIIQMEDGYLRIEDSYTGYVSWSKTGDERDEQIELIQAADGKWLEGSWSERSNQYTRSSDATGMMWENSRSRFPRGKWAKIETAIRNCK